MLSQAIETGRIVIDLNKRSVTFRILAGNRAVSSLKETWPAEVLICDFDGMVDLSIEIATEVEIRSENRPLALALVTEEFRSRSLLEDSLKGAFRSEILSLRNTSVDSLFSPVGFGPALEMLHFMSFANGLERESRRLIGELRAAKDKLQLRLVEIQQRQRQLQKPKPGITEITSRIRSVLQQACASYEKNCELRLHNLLAPAGQMWSEATNLIEKITLSIDESGSHAISFRISTENYEKVARGLLALMQTHTDTDVVNLRSIGDELQTSMNAYLTDLELRTDSDLFRFPIPGPRQIDCILGPLVTFQREYEGEIGKPGIMDRLFGLRKYYFVLSMILTPLGLLTPLRKHPLVYIPVVILLFAAGAFRSFKSQRIANSAAQDRELQKSKEWLRGEVKRMLSDFQTKWTSTLRQCTSDRIAEIVSAAEIQIRAQLQATTDRATERKQTTQLELQNTQALDKQLASAEKTLEPLLTSIHGYKDEGRQILKNAHVVTTSGEVN